MHSFAFKTIRSGATHGLIFGLLAVVLTSSAGAQTLARKGWSGSGIKIDPWWKSAIFYQLDPLTFQDSNGDGFGDLQGVVSRLDYLQELGVDAVVLSPVPLQFSGSGGPALDPMYGTEEDFDRLERDAGTRHIRILVDLSPTTGDSIQPTTAAARFWLSRGVSGFVFNLESQRNVRAADRTAASEKLRLLRRICAGYAGDRVVITAAPADGPARVEARGSINRRAAELLIDDTLTTAHDLSPATLRAMLSPALTSPPIAVLDANVPGLQRSYERLSPDMFSAASARAKLAAAALMLGREIPLLYFGQEIGMTGEDADLSPMQWGSVSGFTAGTSWIEMASSSPTVNVDLENHDAASLLSWYRTLGQLHHTAVALRGGSITSFELKNPDIVAWVRRSPGANGQTLLVICNASSQRATVFPRTALGSFVRGARSLRTLAISTGSFPESVSTEPLQLPAFSVWVGEIRQPGLEDAPAPVLPSRHRGR